MRVAVAAYRAFGLMENSEEAFAREIRGLHPKRILEIGGANRPLSTLGTAREQVGIDIDGTVPWQSIYTAYHNQSAELPIPGLQADLIVSKYVLEHIPDNRRLFANIREWLAPGGRSVHLFPLGWHPYSVVNRVIGNRVARFLIPLVLPGLEGLLGYPAYYHLSTAWSSSRCSGSWGCAIASGTSMKPSTTSGSSRRWGCSSCWSTSCARD